MILDFWAEWCAACKELDRTVWADPRVRAEASRFVAVKIDGTEYTDAFDAIAAKKYAVPGLPTVIFLDGRGREAPRRVLGAVDPEEMIAALRAVDGACEDPPAPPPRAPGAIVACAVRW